jgi:glycosyltransferase involved in cell wall biosynthesis
MRHPATLIVSESPFCLSNGFGVTLTTLFTGWPADRLRQIYTRTGAEPSRDVCPHIVYGDVPGHWGRRHAIALLLGRRPTWRGRYSLAWLKRALQGWQPELVYALIFSGETLAFAAWIARRFECPLIVHAADDGLERYKAGVSQDIGGLLAGAKGRIVISEEMRVDYEKRYDLEFDVLHNGADDLLFLPPAAAPDTGALTIRYLGSVVPIHHFHALEDIGAAVKLLNQKGIKARFELCGGDGKADALSLVDHETVIYRGPVGKLEGHQLLRTAGLLVIPINFEPADFSFVRLSLPTKLPEYLASGTPTLVYGPAGAAPVEFCARHKVGSVLTERSVSKLAEFFESFWRNRERFRQNAIRDREFIRANFSARAVRKKFNGIIQAAAAAV